MHSEPTADSGTVSTYQILAVELLTNKWLEALNKAYIHIQGGPKVGGQ